MDNKKKNLIIIIGIALVVIIIIIIVISSLSGGSSKKLTYKELEQKIKEVGEEYYKENTSLLPKNDGDTRQISVDDLVKLELMKPIDELLAEDATCKGTLTVKKEKGKYFYVPLLDCGDDYITSELYKKIIDDNKVVESGNGLYLQENIYTFRGENLNNYVKLSDKKWRIVSIDAEGNLKLILDTEMETAVPWDDRYNGDRQYTSGINDYSVSRIKDQLNELYESDDLLDENAKKLVVSKDFCVSGKNKNDKISVIDCEKYVENINIGLLNINEYTNASIDPKCETVSSKECQNYNYLKANDSSSGWWTMTPNKENTYEVFYIENSGTVDIKSCSSYSKIKPVIYINKDIMFSEGNGTKDKPYVIE